jgi:hypothetical protein
VFLSYNDGDDHVIRRANTERALARWQCLGVLHGVTNILHQSMCLTLYEPDGMVVAFALYCIKKNYIVVNRVAIKFIITLTIHRFN